MGSCNGNGGRLLIGGSSDLGAAEPPARSGFGTSSSRRHPATARGAETATAIRARKVRRVGERIIVRVRSGERARALRVLAEVAPDIEVMILEDAIQL